MDSLDPVSKKEFSEEDYWTWRYDCNDGQFEFVAETGLQEVKLALIRALDHLKRELVARENPDGHISIDTPSILEIGVGTSRLMNECTHIFGLVTCTDVCGELMDKRQAEEGVAGKISFEHADAVALPYADQKFDVIVEKGTLDALMCDTSDTGLQKSRKALREMLRVARTAVWSISYASPESMKILGEFTSNEVINGDPSSLHDYDCSRIYTFLCF